MHRTPAHHTLWTRFAAVGLTLTALALAACQTSPARPAAEEAEDPRACSREYTGGAASALAGSAQGCAVAPPGYFQSN